MLPVLQMVTSAGPMTPVTAAGKQGASAATTPKLPPVMTPVANWVTEPLVEVKRTVLAAPAVSAWLTSRLPVLQMVTSAGPVTPVTAAGKQGASAVTVLPSVSVATLSLNLT